MSTVYSGGLRFIGGLITGFAARLDQVLMGMEAAITALETGGAVDTFTVYADTEDETAGTLIEKLQAGDNITLTSIDDEGTQKIKIDAAGSPAAPRDLARMLIKICADDVELTEGDGQCVIFIPDELDGYALIAAHAMVSTPSTDGLPTVQIRNVTDTADMLSTRITIDEDEYDSYNATAAPVIDTDHDDVATGDRIAIDVDVTGDGSKGLTVYLAFQAPEAV